ncbi:PREDICTED: uncharacterized protein LOC106744620 [Dinoponera quadriceps]|uniref:Uncharacterized protein LOC106744620 n=1 Tax=Dinoponera quadriceps TaxID=609295 RepID=A0A6P3X9U6_DINQU|nr:PREDICTED: uncharacterized protein LOC106744620 [Dinoponera quadriceps]
MQYRPRQSREIQVRNVHHKHDIRYAMQLCRWILKPIGIWHFVHRRSSQNERLLSTTLIFMCVSVLCFVLVPSGPYVLFREKDTYVKVKLFGPIGFCLTSAVKYCFLGMYGTAIGRCIGHVEDDWRVVWDADHRKMMLKNALLGHRLTTLCVLFLYTGGLSYHTIMPLSAKVKINNSFTIRPLVYPGYDQYFDSQASPAYEILFCMHCLSSIIQYSITTAACSLAAIFVTHACGQVQVLTMLLDDLVNGKRNDDNTTVEKRLRVITRHHVRVLRFTADVEEVLREICLMELVAATLIICLVEYYCMMVKEIG